MAAKFKFSLEKLLKQRHIKVDLAQKDFFESQKKFEDEQKKYQDLLDTKHQAFEEREKIVRTEKSWFHQVEQINLFLQGQDLRIVAQNERLKQAEKEVEKYREILRNALIDVKMVEELRARKKAEFVKEVLSAEQAELDELVTLRFNRSEKE